MAANNHGASCALTARHFTGKNVLHAVHPSQLRERNRTPALSVEREHAPLTSAKPDLGTSGYNYSQQAGCSPSTRPCRPGPAAVDALQREVRRTQDPAVQRQSIRIHQLHVWPSDRLNLAEALLTASASPLTVSRTF